MNEIANNGAIAFAAAAWTGNLDYGAYYKTLPKDEAYQRARRLLAEPDTNSSDDGQSIRRRVAGDPARPRLNVVIFLEESLGSEFWGCLGRTNTLTPEMDKLAAEEGLLFTNIYASGNRTVRGMEGVLSSFPPLPGESIVKRDRSDNVETIARVLKRDGYKTFSLRRTRPLRRHALLRRAQRLRPFHRAEAFRASDFRHDLGRVRRRLFTRAVQEFRALANGQAVPRHHPVRFQSQALHLSQGRIPEDPDPPTREKAVKYSD